MQFPATQVHDAVSIPEAEPQVSREALRDTLVLIPAYDPDSDELRRTLASVAAQTLPVDVCLLDDGSTPPITSLLADETDIVVLRSERNAGITEVLRRGVEYGLFQDYRYIARLDVGDRSRADRMEIQHRHMEAHPEIDLLGSRARIVDREGRHLYDFGITGSDDALRSYLWRNSIFRHSTFFIRADAIRRIGNYDPDFKLAQDYEMLLRYCRHGKVAIVPDLLIDYVDDPSGLTMQRRRKQLRMRLKAQMRHLDPLVPGWYAGVARTLVTTVVPVSMAKVLSRWMALRQRKSANAPGRELK